MFDRSRHRLIRLAGILAAVAVACLAPAGRSDAAAPDKVLGDLLAAHAGEMNAHARYLAFAKKADQEGYAGVASLFRAATAENLKAAVEAESSERDKTYPAYIADALAARNKDAIKDLKAAVAVEAEHAKLFSQAASSLSSWKAARKFFVCQTCGLPVLVIDFNKCPICFSEASDFIEVS